MNTRRQLFKILAVTPAALPALAATPQQNKEIETQPGHLHTGPTVKVPEPSQPTFFQASEFRMVEALTERIIPRSDTPGAKDAGVTLLIDKAIVADASVAEPFRAGLADLNAVSVSTYGQEFVELTEQQQIAVLTPMSLQPDSPLGKFFAMVKDMTIDAYYKTEAGLKTELGWRGNTFLPSFPGCQHPEHQS
jgi:gluconate 2-dehydrogenase subunit 3-like protein